MLLGPDKTEVTNDGKGCYKKTQYQYAVANQMSVFRWPGNFGLVPASNETALLLHSN